MKRSLGDALFYLILELAIIFAVIQINDLIPAPKGISGVALALIVLTIAFLAKYYHSEI